MAEKREKRLSKKRESEYERRKSVSPKRKEKIAESMMLFLES